MAILIFKNISEEINKKLSFKIVKYIAEIEANISENFSIEELWETKNK